MIAKTVSVGIPAISSLKIVCKFDFLLFLDKNKKLKFKSYISP
jgi:hypothetical protein